MNHKLYTPYVMTFIVLALTLLFFASVYSSAGSDLPSDSDYVTCGGGCEGGCAAIGDEVNCTADGCICGCEVDFYDDEGEYEETITWWGMC